MVEIRDIMGAKFNNKGCQSLKQRLKLMAQRKLQVGWFNGVSYTDSTSVKSVALQNEFGNLSKHIPPRPFLRPAVANNRTEWVSVLNEMLFEELKGKNALGSSLSVLGETVKADIKISIESVTTPVIADSTLVGRYLYSTGNIAPTLAEIYETMSEAKTNQSLNAQINSTPDHPLIHTFFMMDSLQAKVTKK